MIKNCLSILIISLLFAGCTANQLKSLNEPQREEVSNSLIDEIGYILFLIKRNDIQTLNTRFVNPTYGVYEVYKADIENKIAYKHLTSFEEISNFVENYEIKQEETVFNCSPYDDSLYGWSKVGVYLTTNIKPYLSSLVVVTPQNQKEKEAELKRISYIEKTSYELTITDNTIFYLTKIDGKWYITLIDNIKTDCSK